MAIRFRCEHCGQKLRVTDDKVGQLARCPKCQTSVLVPESGIEPPSATLESPAPATPPPAPIASPPPVPESDEPDSGDRESAPLILATGDDAGDDQPVGNRASEPESQPRLDDRILWRSDRSEASRAHPVALESFARESNAGRFAELPEIVIRDDWDDESAGRGGGGSEIVVDYDKVAVPRRVLYFQGLLLALVAVVSFALGTQVRRPAPNTNPMLARPPATLTGQVTYGGDHQVDAGAVVVVLPHDRRPEPESRLDVAGLRPSDPAPLDDHPTLRALRALGGELSRTNAQGAYQVRLPQTGRYYVLIISRRGVRGENDRVEVTDMAQMGRYFASATELLEDRRYLWRTMTLTGSDMFDADFE